MLQYAVQCYVCRNEWSLPAPICVFFMFVSGRTFVPLQTFPIHAQDCWK